MTSLCASRFDKKCGKSGIPDNAKCSKKTTASSSSNSSGSGTAKKRNLLNRVVRKVSGAERRERTAKYEKEQAVREKKYGKHSPMANGAEAVQVNSAMGRFYKSKGIDPTKIGANSDFNIEVTERTKFVDKNQYSVRLNPSDKKTKAMIESLPAQYRLRKEMRDSLWAEGF